MRLSCTCIFPELAGVLTHASGINVRVRTSGFALAQGWSRLSHHDSVFQGQHVTHFIRQARVFLLAFGLLVPAGCGLRMPNLPAPGYLYEQQLRATFHDPYPATQVAPEIEGGRPPGYEMPRDQAVKSQWFFDSGPPS